MMAENVLDLIGNTPLVRVTSPREDVEIYLKLEKFNPGGSVKDRIAKYMIEDAERRGELSQGKIVMEATSGNTGIGLAMVCAVKGYDFVAVMPENATEERKRMMVSMGATVVLTDACRGLDCSIDYVRDLASRFPDLFFVPDQYSNESNVRAHYETTGVEILRDIGDRITHFVAGMGTTGTIVGVSRRLKEHNPDIVTVGVQFHESSPPIPGLKNLNIQYVPGIWKDEYLGTLVDRIEYVHLSDAEAFASQLSTRDGVHVGTSSGAAYGVAWELAKTLKEGVIVAIAPDGGDRYLSTTLINPVTYKSRVISDREFYRRVKEYA